MTTTPLPLATDAPPAPRPKATLREAAVVLGLPVGSMNASTIVALLALALCAACKVERLRHPDSGSGAVTLDSSATAAAQAYADSLVGVPPDTEVVPAAQIAPVAPPFPAAPGDTMPIVATPDELRDLARRLAIPVDGVQPGDLHDTFTESRGGGSRPHDALDIPAPRGTPVRSATDGTLRKLHSSVAGGLMVYAADASDRFVLMYGHLDRYADGLVEGMPLRQGQVIGYVGTTGNAPAGTPHLHFAIARGRPSVKWWKGTPVNPYPLLAARP